jgi:surface antigen
MKSKLLALALVASLSLGACAQNGQPNEWGMGNKQTIGTAGGAIVGGLLGSKVGKGSGQLWATGAGALLGAFAGSSVGKSLDQADMAYHQQATQQAFNAPINQPISWNNPQSGHSGTITPVQEGTRGGAHCRKFNQAILIDGKAETAVSVACQNADGTWTVQ